MNCLKGYIGIKGCGAPADAEVPNPLPAGKTEADYFSGLYVNQLPGINLQMLEVSADAEQENYVKLWEDVEKRALLKFALATKAELNKCYRITDPSVVECLVCESKILFSVALWYFLGVEIMIEVTSSDQWNRWTTIDRDQAEKLKADFFIEFQASLSDAVQSINPNKSHCVECAVESNDAVRWREQTP